jgi:deazaflavin-dependent oxidoreductase (nitroreductase family)
MQSTSVQIHKVPSFVSLLNPLMAGLVRLGLPTGADMRLLTVRGRASGRDRTTPVAVFEHDGALFLFGTFGDTQWVRNLRAAGEAVLARGRQQSRVLATELTNEEAAPVLRGALERYLATPMRPFLARYYAGSADGPIDDFVELARHHPVFRLREASR